MAPRYSWRKKKYDSASRSYGWDLFYQGKELGTVFARFGETEIFQWVCIVDGFLGRSCDLNITYTDPELAKADCKAWAKSPYKTLKRDTQDTAAVENNLMKTSPEPLMDENLVSLVLPSDQEIYLASIASAGKSIEVLASQMKAEEPNNQTILRAVHGLIRDLAKAHRHADGTQLPEGFPAAFDLDEKLQDWSYHIERAYHHTT